MGHKKDVAVEIRSTLIHLHTLLSEGPHPTQTVEAFDSFTHDLEDILGEDLSDWDTKDSYGEIEYLRWAMSGMQNLLGYSSDEEMEEAINKDE